jgi:hypothetical protein
MLNTKYYIVRGKNKRPQAMRNPNALGHAWFVSNYRIVANPDSAITALNNFNPSKTAIVEKQHASELKGKDFSQDTAATIELQSYEPNHLVYTTQSNKEQLAVFSEIFYPEGWQAYIDGKEAKHFRVNYILRGMVIPEGKHKVEFEFKPKAYYTGRTIAAVSSVLLILILIGGIVMGIRNTAANREDEKQK